jgi:hypothetical protein
MGTVLFRRKGEQFFDSYGRMLAGGQMYYHVANTTTPQDTYSEQTGVTSNSNPITLDASGRLATPVYLGSNYDYKETLKDANGVTVSSWPFDNIPKSATAPATVTGFERLYLPFTQVSSVSSPVTLLVANAGYGYEADATGGAIIFNLPDVTTITPGTGYFFKRVDASVYNVTLTPHGTDPIDGANASVIVPPGYNGIYLVCDGSAWMCYSFHSPHARLAGAKQAVTANGATTINMNLGCHVILALAANSTLAVSNAPPSGSLGKLVIEINNGGAFNITSWPGTVVWTGGIVPTITSGSGKKDSVVLTTIDGGTNWRGYLTAQNMS